MREKKWNSRPTGGRRRKGFRSILWIGGLILVIGGSVAVAAVFRIQDHMIFYPNQYQEGYDRLKADSRFEEIVAELPGGGKVCGWYRRSDEALESGKAPLLIYFGGNMQSSASAFTAWQQDDRWNYFRDCSVLMLDYPGYGLSEGSPSEKSIFEMAEAAYDFGAAMEATDPTQIVIMGFSIGTGPASYLASQRQVSGLVLLAPYDELTNMYNLYVNIFHGPLKLLAKHKFESVEYAKYVEVSPLIIASKGDQVIPYTMSERLAKAFSAGAEFILLDGTDQGPEGPVSHNDVASRQSSFQSIYEYLEKTHSAS